MNRSVVCGVDWSDESIAAAHVAASLSRRLGGRLVLAHAVEGFPAFPHGRHEVGLHRAHTDATRLFDRLRQRFGSLDGDGRVLWGAPADALAELAAEEDAELLVVGSRGRGAVKAALFGSVSSALSRTANRPVVIVRAGVALPDPDTRGERRPIVCGIDDSPHARSTAHVAAGLAAALATELVLVHAHSPVRSAATIPAAGVAPPVDHEALDEERRRAGEALLRELAAEVGVEATVSTRLEADSPASVLDRCAREEGAELIVVGTQGHGPLASALLGSTSLALAASGSVPVALVPERAAAA